MIPYKILCYEYHKYAFDFSIIASNIKMIEWVIYTFTTILALLLTYLIFERFTSKTNHIPQPWSWPFLKHYPYFVKKDHVKLYADFAEPYQKAGKEFFKVDNLSRELLGCFILFLSCSDLLTLGFSLLAGRTATVHHRISKVLSLHRISN